MRKFQLTWKSRNKNSHFQLQKAQTGLRVSEIIWHLMSYIAISFTSLATFFCYKDRDQSVSSICKFYWPILPLRADWSLLIIIFAETLMTLTTHSGESEFMFCRADPRYQRLPLPEFLFECGAAWLFECGLVLFQLVKRTRCLLQWNQTEFNPFT